MAITPNRIVLISRGRHEEDISSANLYPGMLLQKQANNNVTFHSVVGGAALPVMVAKEEALGGQDITQQLPSGNATPYQVAAKGDKLLMLLQNGQNVAAQANLMSAGDGTLMANPGSVLYQILAASTGITNTTAETVFSNGSYTVPANFLQIGDVLRVFGRAVVSAQNSTNTHDVKVELGTGHTVLADSGAVALTAAQYVEFDFYMTVRTIGASGTYDLDGNVTSNPGGTVGVTPLSVTAAAIDTTVAELFRVTSTASAASTGNVIALQDYQISITRAGGLQTVAVAQEAINNSGGTGTSGFNSAAFIRCTIP